MGSFAGPLINTQTSSVKTTLISPSQSLSFATLSFSLAWNFSR